MFQRNFCSQDVKEVLIKILLYLGVMEFLIKFLVIFVSEEVGMIISIRGSISKFSDHGF